MFEARDFQTHLEVFLSRRDDTGPVLREAHPKGDRMERLTGEERVAPPVPDAKVAVARAASGCQELA